MIKIVVFILLSQSAYGQLVIKSESDIQKIQLGDSYYIDGPDDPIEFFEFLQRFEPLVDEHIQNLIKDNKKQSEMSPIYKDINQCLITHTLSTNQRKFLVDDLRAYAIEIAGLNKSMVNTINKPKLIQLLQDLYK